MKTLFAAVSALVALAGVAAGSTPAPSASQPIFVPSPPATVSVACEQIFLGFELDYWPTTEDQSFTARFTASGGGHVVFCANFECAQTDIDPSWQTRAVTLTVQPPLGDRERPVNLYMVITGSPCGSLYEPISVDAVNYQVR